MPWHEQKFSQNNMKEQLTESISLYQRYRNTFRSSGAVMYEQQAVQRIAAQAEKLIGSLQLIVPWGISYPNAPTNFENTAMERIASFQDALDSVVKTDVIILPTDTTPDPTSPISAFAPGYINRLIGQSDQYGFKIQPWSAMRKENKRTYDDYCETLNSFVLQDKVTPKQLYDTYQRTQARSTFTNPGLIHQQVVWELKDQLAQAMLIEKLYRPLIIPLTPIEEDTGLFSTTPRMFIMPNTEKNSWIK